MQKNKKYRMGCSGEKEKLEQCQSQKYVKISHKTEKRKIAVVVVTIKQININTIN